MATATCQLCGTEGTLTARGTCRDLVLPFTALPAGLSLRIVRDPQTPDRPRIGLAKMPADAIDALRPRLMEAGFDLARDVWAREGRDYLVFAQ
jgi:hypothetical protein